MFTTQDMILHQQVILWIVYALEIQSHIAFLLKAVQIIIVSQALIIHQALGTATLNAALCIDYTAPANYFGMDEVSVTVENDYGLLQEVCLEFYVCNGGDLEVGSVPTVITIECTAPVPEPPLPVTGSGCLEVEFTETLISGSGGCADNTYTLQREWITRGYCGDDSIAFTQTVNVIDNTPPTLTNIPADVEIQCDDCLSSFLNGDFEQPGFGGSWASIHEDDIPGWSTTASDDRIEIQKSGGVNGVASYQGNYHAELNGNNNGDFYQEFCTVPTTTLQISFAHHKRMSGNNPTDDIMAVYAGSDINNLTWLGTFTATSASGWVVHTVNYSVPDGQTSSVFAFRAIQGAPSGLTYGNLIDDINVVVLFETDETPDAFDNCDSDVELAVSEERIDGLCTDHFQLIRTWTATDNCGNQSFGSQILTVGDFEPPVFTIIPEDVTVDCSTIPPPPASMVSYDSCDVTTTVDIFYNELELIIGDSCNYTITRTWTSADACGNEGTIAQVITVQDITPPVFANVPADITVDCGAIPAPINPTATDNCTSATINLVESEPASSCSGNYTILRTWTATDNCGNQSTAEQYVLVVDSNPPALTGVPADATVNCSAIPSPANVQAIDDCAANIVVDFVETTVAGGCSSGGIITRTWTASDSCGNSATASQQIVVLDQSPPVITSMPADVTIGCLDTPTVDYPTATDNCDLSVTISYSDQIVIENCPNNYSILRTWLVVDDCNNQTSQIQTITVEDVTPPAISISPADLTVNCHEVPAPTYPSYSDLCGGTVTIDFNQVKNTNNCEDNYTIINSWTATDECGNSSTAVQTITVIDVIPPVITNMPNDTVVECSGIPAVTYPTTTDNCDNPVIVVFTEQHDSTDCNNNTIIRTWEATDNCGNASIATQTIIIIDTTDPVLTGVPSDATVECDAIPSAATVTATDNCSTGLTVDYSETTGTGCPYTITRTWTTTDDCGNTATATQTINVIDTTDPVLAGVPSDATVECDAIPSAATVTATDNCSTGLTVDYSETTGTGCPYTITRTWTTTDDCGNTATATQTINVIDTTDPVLAGVPADATVECDAIPSAATVTATDNCSVNLTVNYSETTGTGCPYTITRTWTTTDDCGNTATATQTINVIDTTDPVLAGVPSDATVECDAIPSAPTVTATDNCSTGLTVNYSETIGTGCPYTITRTWTATDDCGNTATATQTINVIDTTDPVLAGVPADATVECDAIPATATVTATDNCSTGLTVDYSETIGTGCPYTITRTWEATDDCGNTATATQTINVIDTTDPVLAGVPSDATVECDAIPSAATVTATDNCSTGLTVNYSETIGTGCPYTITRTWTTTDDCGNTSTATQTINVIDTTDPVLAGVPADATVECDAIPSASTVTATDNCSTGLTVNYSETIGTGCPYTITRTWTATDDCGNTATATQTINVIDTTDPVLAGVPADATVECDAIPAAATVTATDNCSTGLTVNYSETIGTGCPYTITRTWEVTDDCGNTTTATQTINVIDTTDPVLVGVPADATVECDAIPSAATVTATDNCSTGLTVDYSETIGTGCPYTITRTWEATDDCGNTATATQTINVIDTTDPVLAGVPSDATVECDAIPSAATVTATDNCSVNLTVNYSETIGTGCPYTITRTWTTTDDCGNTATATQTINVIDTTDPVLAGVPSDATVECDAIPSASTVTATDNCSVNLTVNYSETIGTGCPYTITRTWTTTDDCGNTATATQTINVIDTTDPVLAGVPSDETVACDAIPSAPTVTATDNCSVNLTVNYSETIGTGCPYTITRMWTTTDDCGNTATATQTINVIDTTDPVLAGVPSDETVACDAIPSAPTVTATDNCSVNLTVNYSETIGTGCPYTITRTWTTTDDCGNTATATQTINVIDTTDPVLAGVPSGATVECDAIPSAPTVTATDNCSVNLTVNYSETIGTGCPYTITRTWTTTDDCGNTATATQTINVIDTTDPVLAGVPSDATVECDAIPSASTVTATDNCSTGLTVNYSETIGTGCPYTITRTWTTTDDCGNTATATQTINVIDTTDPVLAGVPSDATVECDAIPSASTVTATDNCSTGLTVDYSETIGTGCPYAITRTWTTTDDCGNTATATQTINVIDTTDPVLAGVPADATVECDAIPSASTVTATDNCSTGLTVNYSETIGTGCPYTITRTWTTTDDCGNTATATQTINVIDTTDPVLAGVPSDATVECDAIPSASTVTATDNCSTGLTVDYSETIGTGCPYTITRTWEATDDCGNTATATQTINVIDTTDPVLADVPSDATVECDAIPSAATVTATDNCRVNLTVNYSETIGTGCPYTITRTWTTTDDCGNTATATQTINVIDTTDPVLAGVPADATVECDAIPSAATVTATDNCSINLTVNYSETIGTGCPYTITRTWTVTDDCGNTSTATQTINVIDTTDPVLAGVPSDITIACDAVLPIVANPTVTDNCDSDVPINYNELTTAGNCGNAYSITRRWTAIDNCGNQIIEDQVITIIDNETPVLSAAPVDLTVNCDNIPSPDVLTATDNCDNNVVVTYSELSSPGICVDQYTIERTWTAIDECGNTTTFNQNVLVINCGPDVSISISPNSMVCENENISLSASLTAGYLTPFYQWQFSGDNGLNWVDLPGVNSASHSFSVSLSDDGLYRVLVTNSLVNINNLACSVISDPIKLTVLPDSPDTDLIEEICQGDNYTIGSNTYTTSGNYPNLFTNVNGCDSLVNLALTVNPVYDINITETICEGESVMVGTSTYTTTGNYSDLLSTENGCDSMVNLSLTVNPIYNIDLTETICEGESFTVGTSTYTTSGNYSDLLSSVNGCDSLVNLTLTIAPFYNVDISETICQGESITVGTSTYMTSGNYTDLLSTVNGCDSVVNLTLNVNSAYNVTLSESLCQGESITVGTNTYTTSGNYIDVLQTVNGCDSTIYLDLTIHPTYVEDVLVQLCEGSTYHGVVYNSDDVITENLFTIYGCDSLVTSYITIVPIIEETIVVELCSGSIYNGQSYTTNDTIIESYVTSGGCDSIINTQIFVYDGASTNIVETVCDGESIIVGSSTYTTSGNYTDVLSTVNGCDSVVNLSLTVNPIYTENISETICEGESIIVGTSTYTTSGNYSDLLSTVNGCDSVVNLSLTVNPIYTENISETICEGESVIVGTSTYTTSGNYTDLLSTVNGCDSVVNLSLTVNPIYTEKISETICEGQSVIVGTSTYTTNGNYTDVLSTVNGCDSVVNLSLTVNPIYTENISETICEGESIIVGSSTYTTSGNYTDVLSTVNGCDSVVNLSLTVHPIFTENISETICEGESVIVGTSSYTTSGNYTDVLSTVNGCDSVVNLSLTVNPIYTENISETICEGESVFVGSSTYTTSGNYSDVLSTVNGCDSVVNLSLTVNPIYTENISETICEGESVIVGSSIYTTSGSYTDVLSTVNGCDSVVNLSLTVNPTYDIDVAETICQGESVVIGTNTYTTSGNYTNLLSSVNGCDSIVNLTLIVNPIYNVNISYTICEGESIEVGNNSYTTSGTFANILSSVNGCDSVVNLNLTVNPIYSIDVSETICEGESVQVGGSFYTTSGNYSDILTTVNGCDSIVNLSLTVNPIYNIDLTETICEGESIVVGTNSYATSGNYTDILTTINGCDSVINLDLTVNPIYNIDLSETICEGESVTVGTSTYTTSGNYSDLLSSVNGCDSVVNLSLTVNPIYSNDIFETICEGESVTVGTSSYTTSGNYTDVLSSVNGCDSVVNLALTVNPIYNIDLSETICEGESVIVGTSTYTTSGNYTDVLTTVNGCDSVVNLALTVNPIYNIDLSETICEGESVVVGTSTYTTSGNYTDVLSTINGCDSVVNLTLTVNPIYNIDLSEIICEGESVTVGTSSYTTSGSYSDLLSSVNGCDSIVNLTLTVLEIEEETVAVELCIGETYDGIVYTSDSTTVDTISTFAGCDSIVTTNITVYPFFDEIVSVEICEGELYQGIPYFSDATIVENLTTSSGCDSTVTTNISVVLTIYEMVNVNLCYGEIYDGVNYTSDTNFTDNYISTGGCDSIVTTQIFVYPEQVTNITETICEGESYEMGGTDYSTTGNYTAVLNSVNGCDSTVNLDLIVFEIEEETIEVDLCFGQTYNGIAYPSDVILIDTLNSSTGCDSILTTNIEVHPVFDETISVEVCEGATYKGVTYNNDAILVENLTTSNGCDSTVTTNISVVLVIEETVNVNLCPGDIYEGTIYNSNATLIDNYVSSGGCDSIVTTIIIVEDILDPVLIGIPGGDVTVECSGIPAAPIVTATDNCATGLTVNYTETVGTGCPYIITRTWTVTDGQGNNTTFVQTITVEDTMDPVLVGVPGDVTVECDAVPAAPIVTATDNCSVSLTVNYTETIGVGCPYVITRTWETTDDCGNTVSETQNITVEDTTSPVLMDIPDDVVLECADCIQSFMNGDFEEHPPIGGWAYLDAGDVPGWSTTSPTSKIEIQRSGSVDGVASYSGEYHAELNSNAVGDFYQEFCTVPTTTLMISFAHHKRMNGSNSTDDEMGVYSGPDLANLTLLGTFTATATSGWTVHTVSFPVPANQASTIFLFRAIQGAPTDNTLGNLIDDITVVTLFETTLPSVSDNCDPSVEISVDNRVIDGACANQMQLVRTWTAVDDCGNIARDSQLVSIGDFQAPVLNNVPADLTVECDNVPNAPIVTATDNCSSGLTVDYNETIGTGCPYIITRTWSVTDDCGNTNTVSQIINVIDSTDPVLVGVPGNTTVECGSVPSAPIVTATDNCSTGLTVNFTETIGTGCPYTITRTWEASDDCGNTTTASQTINVIDSTDPVLVGVPGNITVECGAVPSAPIVTATDNCSTGLTVNYNEVIGTGCPYIITRTWDSTDDCGNTTTAIQTITVEDITNPVLVGVPADETVECNAIPSIPIVTATDNCSTGLTVDYNETIGSGCLYTITRSWTVTDDCGNTTTAIQTITVEDTTDPVLVGVPADETVACDAIPTAPTVTATDNCSAGLTVSYTETIGTGCPYMITRTWSVTDDCGNTTTASQTINVIDTTDPVLVGVPADETVECDAIPSIPTVTANDNCSTGLTVSYIETIGTGCPYTITRTWEVTDDCGNTATATQTINVIDATDPVLVGVPADETVECNAIPSAPIVTANDNCSTGLTVDYTETIGTGCPYTITRSWSTTDSCGNTTIETQAINVIDTTDPVLVGVPADESVECNSIPSAPTVTATDNCSTGLTVDYTETIGTGCPFIITRTWSVSDDCGNFTSISQTINVIDNTSPVLVGVPVDITVECDAIPIAPTVTATDDCSIGLAVNYNEIVGTGCQFTITRTWSVTDDCGNTTTATQTISVDDTTSPVLVGVPADVTVECNAIPNAPIVTASDNCSTSLAVNYNQVIGTGCQYTITRTWTVSDNCGNTATATQTISVDDTTLPVLVGVPTDMTVDCNTVPSAPTVTASDNCSNILMVDYNETIGSGCPYFITRSWSVTDNCGNIATETQTITVDDITDPVLVGIPADITVECNAIPSVAVPIATDNCDTNIEISFSETTTQGNCTDAYIITRTWTATDNCGNTDTESQIISVEDTTNPILSSVPADITVECDDIPAVVNPTANDNCDIDVIVSLIETTVPGNCTDSYTILRTWTAEDNCGNSASTVQEVTVIDTTEPILSGIPNDTIVQCGEIPAIAVPVATDNCDDIVDIVYSEQVDSTACSSYAITRIWTATDNCGNQIVENQVITVIDNVSPELSAAPADLTVSCDSIPNPEVLTATDNCDNNVVISYSEVSSQGICVDQHTIERTWTATDACGNSTNYNQTITVIDCGPEIQLNISPNPIVCEKEQVSLTANLTAGYPTPYYKWQFSNNNGLNWDDLPGVNVPENTFTILSISPAEAGLYRVLVSNSITNIDNPDCNKVSDPVEVIVLEESPDTELIEEICEGESYTMGADTYTTSGNYSTQLKNINGCDSTVNLTLTVIETEEETVTVALCFGASYDGIAYTADSTLIDTLSAITGCDSIVTTNIVVNPIYTDTTVVQVCEGDDYEGIVYAVDTLLTNVLQTVNGCDSILNTQINITPIVATSIDVDLCYNGEYDGNYYTENTILVDTYTSSANCDSIVTTNIFVHEEIVYNLAEQICEGESYELGDSSYTETGVYYAVLESVYGCDSIVTMNLLVIDVYTSTIYANICEGESYTINGVSQTTPGTYSDTLINTNGCPIILITNLAVHPVYENSVETSICEGQSIFVGGDYQTESGTYIDNYPTAVYGCDSIIITELIVHPVYESTVTVDICEGESYFAGGADQTTSGTYTDVYETINECDSVIITVLQVIEDQVTDVPYSMCDGDSILVDGVYYTEEGEYYETYYNQNGCDSLINFVVEIINGSDIYVEEVICEGDSIYLAGAYRTNEGEYIEQFTAASGCDSTVTTSLFIEESTELIAEDQEICFGEEVQLLVEGSSNVSWSPAEGLSCVDCTNPIANPRETTTYTVSAESCLGTTTQTTVTVVVNHPPSLTLSSDASVVQNEAITLSAVSSDPNALITWYVNGEVVCEDCKEYRAEPTVSLAYLVTVENEFGCINSDEIYLELEDGCSFSHFEVPNIISPNGDGSNDYFKIKYEGVNDVSLLRIYNRWGELIFETKNIDTLWDGTYRGEKLNPGVYVYYFEGHCLDNKLFTKTGNITLLK